MSTDLCNLGSSEFQCVMTLSCLPASPYTGLSDAWGVGQHLEHRSSGLSESDVLFLWLLCAGGKCFDHLQAHQTLDQPAYASMRA